MDGKRFEVAFDQDKGISYIVRYFDYYSFVGKLDVELYDPMTGERVHKCKFLMEHLEEADNGSIHENYRFPVVIKKGLSMYMCMPRLACAAREYYFKDSPVFVTW